MPPSAGALRGQIFRSTASTLTQAAATRGLEADRFAKLAARIESLADKELAQVSQHGSPLACKAGCDACCHGQIYATGPEILRIVEAVADFSPEDRSKLLARLAAFVQLLAPDRGEGYLRSRAPCPFLRDGRCSIYEARPLMCRGRASDDVARCVLWRDHPEERNDVEGPNGEGAFSREALQGVLEGLRAANVPWAALEMPRTVLRLLSDPVSQSDFLANTEAYVVRKAPPWRKSFSNPNPNPLATVAPSAQYRAFVEARFGGPFADKLPLVATAATENLLAKIVTPRIYESSDQVAEWRAYFENAVREALEFEPWDARQAYQALTDFHPVIAAYQPYSMRAPMSAIGQILVEKTARRLAPELLEPLGPRRAGKIRVGIASYNLRENSGANWALGWLRNLDRERFEAYAFKLYGQEDATSFAFKDASDHYFHLSGNPLEMARWIRELDLDYLFFPDLGDFGINYQLAVFRLAHRQAAGWGCPFTSGLPTIDDFLSSELMEAAGSEAEYTENLVRLPNTGLTVPPFLGGFEHLRRSDFRLPDGFLVAFPQYIAKWLPNRDELLRRISLAIANPIVMFEMGSEIELRIFKKRMDDLGVRIQWLKTDIPAVFRQIVRLCDVALDSPDWSGGLTAMHALSVHTPFVTLNGPYLRQRLASASLRVAGVAGLVAENADDYVALATNQGRLQAVMSSLQVAALFDDVAPIRALENHVLATL